MELDDLERFIVAAKAATYAGDGEPAAPSRPGSHDLTHADGEWEYRDSYFGGRDFLGQEVVWHAREPVWVMNYYGWISEPDAISGKETGHAIQTALSQLYTQGRFLGGHIQVVNGWEYRDESTGDVSHFEGSEQISGVDGTVVYQLRYHGGLIRD